MQSGFLACLDLHVPVCFYCLSLQGSGDTHVKQKKRVVDPTRKVVAADTGT